jgi:hypothetical protein
VFVTSTHFHASLLFVGKVRRSLPLEWSSVKNSPRVGSILASDNRLGGKLVAVVNTPAYCYTATITAVKIVLVLAQDPVLFRNVVS